MLTLPAVLWVFVLFFGVIGATRGWAKEMLVIFSMVLGLFIIIVVEQYLGRTLSAQPPSTQFVIRAAFILLMAFFGYQTPSFPNLGGKIPAREKLQDWMLGLFLGMINGYLIGGMLWHYLHQAGYPLQPWVVAPERTNEHIMGFLKYLPPAVLQVPYIYFAVGLSFLFVIIVFV